MELYHGSQNKIDGPLQPVLKHDLPDHVHTQAAVFGTARLDLAALFMFPFDQHLASLGFEENIAYICIWGTLGESSTKDHGGFIYTLPDETFEKIGKAYEWQSFTPVTPTKVIHFKSVIDGMIQCGVQVYFINDNEIFDLIVANKAHRALILKSLISENQKRNLNIKIFE